MFWAPAEQSSVTVILKVINKLKCGQIRAFFQLGISLTLFSFAEAGLFLAFEAIFTSLRGLRDNVASYYVDCAMAISYYARAGSLKIHCTSAFV